MNLAPLKSKRMGPNRSNAFKNNCGLPSGSHRLIRRASKRPLPVSLLKRVQAGEDISLNEAIGFLPGRHARPLPRGFTRQRLALQENVLKQLCTNVIPLREAPKHLVERFHHSMSIVLAQPHRHPTLLDYALQMESRWRSSSDTTHLVRLLEKETSPTQRENILASVFHHQPHEGAAMILESIIARLYPQFTGEIKTSPLSRLNAYISLLEHLTPSKKRFHQFITSIAGHSELSLAEIHEKYTGRGVKIKVVDFEFGPANHPDFAGANYRQTGEGGGNEAHGTSVASVVAGRITGGIAPGAEVTGHYVSNAEDQTFILPAAAAIMEEVRKPRGYSRIMVFTFFNTNLRGGRQDREELAEKTRTWNEALEAAYQKEILIFCCAGNFWEENKRDEELGQLSPFHQSPHLMVVGAAVKRDTNGNYRPADYSAIGGTDRSIDILAPSDFIMASANNRFTILQGTSFSTPYCAGVAALMLEANPQLTAGQGYGLFKQSPIPMQTADGNMQGNRLINPPHIIAQAEAFV